MDSSLLIGAVIVTYHPRAVDLRNLAGIRAQVDVLIVVDNGSDEAELAHVREATSSPHVYLIENKENLGIAVALNRGIKAANSLGCSLVALFDQDSELTEGFIASMLADFKSYSRDKPIMQIIPRYLDPATGTERPVSPYEDGGAFLTITSGSVFSMQVFEQCGLFREDLFIYCVDDDFSLRIRKSGFYIGVSDHAVLRHQSGRPSYRKIFGRTIQTKNYRPEVRYYYARNKVWILRQYARDFPRLIVPTLREFLLTPIKIALLEDAARKKVGYFFLGLIHGLTGRMGRLART